MNINVKKTIQRHATNHISNAIEVTRTLWELMTIAALHKAFGFGKKRLLDFANALQESYNALSDEADITDRSSGRKATNLDTAAIRAVRDLRSDGIDYREILRISHDLVIDNPDGTQTNVDKIVDMLEATDKERRESAWQSIR